MFGEVVSPAPYEAHKIATHAMIAPGDAPPLINPYKPALGS